MSDSPTPAHTAFAELDAFTETTVSGVLEVICDASTVPAAMAHVMRRLRRNYQSTVMGKTRIGCSPWQEVASRLGLGALAGNAVDASRMLEAALMSTNAAVVIERGAPDSYDARVTQRLIDSWQGKIITVGATAPLPNSRRIELSGALTEGDKLLWLTALTGDHAQLSGVPSMADLELWWRRVRAHEIELKNDNFSDEVRELIAIFALIGRPVPIDAAVQIPGFEAHTALLRSHGVLTVFDGFVQVAYEWTARADALATAAAPWAVREARTVLSVLTDPWARLQDSVLAARIGDLEAASTSFGRVLRGTVDPRLRAEFHERLLALTVRQNPERHEAFAVRIARASVEVGDQALAEDWINAARMGASPEGSVVLGRAALGRGDLAGAKVAFERARTEAGAGPIADEALVGLAETHAIAGRAEIARELAEQVVKNGVSLLAKSSARNLIGKGLLAQAKWEEAEVHFAEDELEAVAHGLDAEAQRARMNRAVALMSSGRLREAQALLESVRDRARELGLHQGVTYAMANLAVIATRRHAYGEALRLWEETAERTEASLDRLTTARNLCNIAEIYISLELYPHARAVLERARAAVRGVGHSQISARIGTLEARIYLGEGNTELAHRALGRAVRDAEASNHALTQTTALVVGARIDLEEGNVVRAREKLQRALSQNVTAFNASQAKLLLALCDRADGAVSIDAFRDVLSEVRSRGDDVLAAEVHASLATVCSEMGAIDEARAHAARARTILEEIGRGLPQVLRGAYMASSRLRALAKLAAGWDADEGRPVAAESVSLSQVAVGAARILGEHPAIRALLTTVRKAASSDMPVLIHGESGTGKELVASALHAWGPRAAEPMVSINCGALVESLLLSELFGHEKGAFTGAQARKRGKFEAAHGGTLFLDEIGDISPRTQVALLRVLQERTFERVGGTTPIKVDVRVVCATHKDLKSLVERGEFRHDLYFRLAGILLEVPPLRKRNSDIPALADGILQRIASTHGTPVQRLGEDALELLMSYGWPGNVRELENVLQTVSLFTDGPRIGAVDLLAHVPNLANRQVVNTEIAQGLPAAEMDASRYIYERLRAGESSLADAKHLIEVECIRYALADSGGNITKAAALLGMKRPRLSQLIKELGMKLNLEEA